MPSSARIPWSFNCISADTGACPASTRFNHSLVTSSLRAASACVSPQRPRHVRIWEACKVEITVDAKVVPVGK